MRVLTLTILLCVVLVEPISAVDYNDPTIRRNSISDNDVFLAFRNMSGGRTFTGKSLKAQFGGTPDWSSITNKPPVFSPTVHSSNHAANGSDPLSVSTAQVSGLDATLGNKVDTSDSRLSDARTPLSHNQAASTVTYGATTVAATLDLLAPAPPANLSTRTLSIAGTYTARESSTGTARSGVINSTTPTITASGAFGDGNSGTLSALIDAVTSGSRILSTASDVGTYTSLQILTDVDPYAGVFGQQGFYKQLTAQIVPSAAVTVKAAHTAQLSHTATGNTPALTWYSDDAVTPSASTPVVSGVTHTSAKHVSGIECLTTGDTIQASASATNAVHSFYNNSQILRFSGSQITTLNYLPGTPPADNASVASGTQNLAVSSGYSAAAQITATAYNSVSGTGASTLTSNVRIDSVSSEAARKLSGSGDWPSTGYGGAYDGTQLLTAGAYLNELQMINGAYQYPPATNYTTNLPAGPNYSTGLGTADRWVTLVIDAAFSGTGRTININGSANFGASSVISGLKMYARVDGSSPTAGWVDLNASYPGVGNPTNNGDAALAPGSTATSRILTFGSITRAGTLYLRIGLPSGSTKSFTGAS